MVAAAESPTAPAHSDGLTSSAQAAAKLQVNVARRAEYIKELRCDSSFLELPTRSPAPAAAMRISRRAIAADEELGKKDDDHRPTAGRTRAPSLLPAWKAPRRRRIVLALVGCYLLYMFFKNMPTDLTPAVERYNPELAQLRRKSGALQSPLDSVSQAVNRPEPPPREKEYEKEDEEDQYYYDGKIRFLYLSRSLRTARNPLGQRGDDTSRPVLFAGADLKSVADLLPIACEMARHGTNDVHFALMGRDDVSIPGIQKVNGISDEDCPLQWHGNYLRYSPDNLFCNSILTYSMYRCAPGLCPMVNRTTHGKSN